MGTMQKQVDSKTFGYIIGALRKIWRWSRERRVCLANAEGDDGYKCAECKKSFIKKEVAVDHIDPVVDPEKGWQGFDDFITRLWCKADGLQVLCKGCHKAKTGKENKIRRKKAA